MAGPLSQVAAAMRAGSRTIRDICAQTGLSNSTVAAAIEHLERSGKLTRRTETASCSGHCSGCEFEEEHRGQGTTCQLGMPTPRRGAPRGLTFYELR
ncbi:FeoC-like transcriptional regulator [Corynebacterium ulceribovis]|uniref:FeoC-like transcriptional regulator n=1 Tax=Corynebacterium ulceribovis TaxID=487732 RepID=UPI0003663E16|nr:FeoC-like transcriptional regulator [Corynebacterium ulceribovis]